MTETLKPNLSGERKTYTGDRVIVGKDKEWSVYANAIEANLRRGNVKVEARGRGNIEKATGVLATMLRWYPDILAEGEMKTVTFKGKEGDEVTAPQVNWIVSTKSPLVRVEQIDRQ